MGLRCFLVVILMMSHSVFARDCVNVLDKSNNCDDCIRCGGTWCSDPYEITQCVIQSEDNWCPVAKELPPSEEVEVKMKSGRFFNTLYLEKRASVGFDNVARIKILRPPPVKSIPVAHYKIFNSSQVSTSDVQIQTKVDSSSNTLIVTSRVGLEFCSPNSTKSESVYVQVGLRGVDEEVVLKYNVLCACACSENVEVNSPTCNGFGDLSCGVCHCKEDREGKHCQTKRKRCSDRGDNPPTCKNPMKPDVMCSGNGHCNECHECECFNDINIEGSQYFDPDNFCEDLCSITSKCTDCLRKPEPGLCDTCEAPYVYVQNVNESYLEDRDEGGRKVWVMCNVTVPDCGLVQYTAMQQNGEKNLMILKTCGGSSETIVAGGGKITIPVVFGLLAAVAAMVAAGVGYMLWKGRGPPPLPLTDPEYTNIDAEDCTGVNPLYKPPTSSFKNPMYGKC